MSTDDLETDRMLRRLLADAVGTLGEAARADVLATAASVATSAREQMRPVEAGDWWDAQDGASLAEAQRYYDRELVDLFQQLVHDLFWDTTWPACPWHPDHPLSYSADHEAWCCPRDGAPIVPLGRLATLRGAATEGDVAADG